MMTDTPPIKPENNQPAAPVSTDPQLLQLLVCPDSKGPLAWDKTASELISPQAGIAFPVRDGVPLLSMEHARKLSEDEIKIWRHQ